MLHSSSDSGDGKLTELPEPMVVPGTLAWIVGCDENCLRPHGHHVSDGFGRA
jgi:hypothetical protein